MPSEDPFHSGTYGVAYTKALQWGADPKYTKAIGALKHYTMYSVEAGRGSTYFDISTYDVADTYLPQFRAPVTQAKSLGYMCSYAALTNADLIPDSGSPAHPHSEPLCASAFFAQTKMRDEFGFEGYVQSDCNAVYNEADGPRHGSGEQWAANNTDAAARALAGGLMNSNCGGGLVGHICAAIAEGLTTEAELEARVERSLTLLMNAGLFDPVELQQYTRIPFETINSEASQRKMLEASKQGMVLLKNPPVPPGTHASAGGASVLPLPTGHGAGELLLLGPHARTQKNLAGNYFEDIGLGTCAGPGCVPTIESSLNAVNAGSANATVLEGCKDMKCAKLDLAAITAAAGNAAVKTVVMAMGTDGTIDGEGHDRMDIRLPGKQADLVQAVLNATSGRDGVRVVLLLFNGGLIALEDLALAPHLAIVECFFPGATGGVGVMQALFGVDNRWGKLPFTYYHYNYTQLSNFTNMNMTETPTQPGRTYKYMSDPSLAAWPFGYGLSYTSFELSAPALSGAARIAAPAWAAFAARHYGAPTTARRALGTRFEREAVATASVTVQNTGAVAGDEVVFLFQNASGPTRHWGGADAPVPLKQLVGYQRVTLAPGASATVTFNLTAQALSTVDVNGTRHVLPGTHGLIFSRGHGEEQQLDLDVELRAGAERAPLRVVVSTMLQDSTAHLHKEE